MEMGSEWGLVTRFRQSNCREEYVKEGQGQNLQNNPRKKKRGRHASYPAMEYFITKTIHESRAIFMKKCSCLNKDLIFKISSYFQIKGHNSVFFDKIKRFAIP